MELHDDCVVGYHFFTVRTIKSCVISLFGLSPLSHIVVSVRTREGTLYYNCSWGVESEWFVGDIPICPTASLYENLTLDLSFVDMVLPKGEYYSLWKVILNFFTGRPQHTLSCVSAVQRLRYISGKETKGRTPGGIYRHLKKERLRDYP